MKNNERRLWTIFVFENEWQQKKQQNERNYVAPTTNSKFHIVFAWKRNKIKNTKQRNEHIK